MDDDIRESTEAGAFKERLMGIQVSYCGVKKTAWEILQTMSDDDLGECLDDVLEHMLQAGDIER